jgi:hypothetical protein
MAIPPAGLLEDAAPARNRASSCPLFWLPSIYLFDRRREVGRRGEETTVPRFGGGVEIGAIPEFIDDPRARTDA